LGQKNQIFPDKNKYGKALLIRTKLDIREHVKG